MKNFTLLLLSVFGTTLAADAQYCMLPGRTIYAAKQPGITQFKLNTIDRTSGNVEKPLNQPSVVVTTDSTWLARGKTYTVTIKHSEDDVSFPGARNNIRVWIDYDKNFKFTDAGETVLTRDTAAPGTTFTGTFTVPMTAPLGSTRLRATAKMGPDAGHYLATPCDDPQDPLDYHGEMEDYTVTIVQFPVAVDELTENMPEVSVYPNPTSARATVQLSEMKAAPLTIAAFDITGKHIADLVTEQVQTATSYDISLGSYTPGVYFIKLTSGSSSVYTKVIKAE